MRIKKNGGLEVIKINGLIERGEEIGETGKEREIGGTFFKEPQSFPEGGKGGDGPLCEQGS